MILGFITVFTVIVMYIKKKVRKLVFIDYLLFFISLVIIALLPIFYVFLGLSEFLFLLLFYYLINLIFFFDVWFKDRMIHEIKIFWTGILILLPLVGGIYYLHNEYIPLKWKVPLYSAMDKYRNLEKETMIKNKDDHFNSLNQEQTISEATENDFNISQNLAKLFQINLDRQSSKSIQNTHVELFESDYDFFNHLVDEIKKAKKVINVMIYNLSNSIIWKEIKSYILERLENNELKINFILDNRLNFPDTEFLFLKDLPNVNFITLEKSKFYFQEGYWKYYFNSNIVIIDNKLAFYGSFNLSRHDLNIDTKIGFNYKSIFLVKGELVNNLTIYFTRIFNYLSESKDVILEEPKNFITTISSRSNYQLVVDGPQVKYTAFLNNLIYLINNAKKSIKIITPVFLPSEKLFLIFEHAITRGIDIKIITSDTLEITRWKKASKVYNHFAVYRGIQIFQTKATAIQSSYYLFDDEIVIFGNANLYYLHYFKKFLSFVITDDKKLIVNINNNFEKIIRNSYKLTLKKYKFGIWNRSKFIFYKYLLPLF